MRERIYSIEWHRDALKTIRSIKDQKLKDYILDAIENVIAHDPLKGKPLVGVSKGIYSYRLGIIRILYKPYKDKLIIIVLRIAHRKDVYK